MLSPISVLKINFKMPLVELYDLPSFQKEFPSRVERLDYVECSKLSYSEFHTNYMHSNKPCVLKGITNNWSCQTEWVKDQKPNLALFKEKYGNAVIPAANCDEKYYNSQSKANMTMNDYVDYWVKYSAAKSGSMPCLYLKDWHFQRDYPDDKVYELPIFFASDWLNEFLLREPDFKDDYRFVYIGPKGSWTPFHADVFSSFSWSVNICGKKRWVFYAPGEEKHLTDRFGSLVYSVESPELEDKILFPHQEGTPHPLVLIQEAGDAVFVPSGWHHQVWNLDDTISINHNWMNGCNIALVWEDMLKKFHEVQEEIKDCEDMDGWVEHCQLLLSSVYGMDLKQFSQFLFHTVKVRLQALKEDRPLVTSLSNHSFGRNHILHDLSSLNSVLNKILKEDIESLINFYDKINQFVEQISDYFD